MSLTRKYDIEEVYRIPEISILFSSKEDLLRIGKRIEFDDIYWRNGERFFGFVAPNSSVEANLISGEWGLTINNDGKKSMTYDEEDCLKDYGNILIKSEDVITKKLDIKKNHGAFELQQEMKINEVICETNPVIHVNSLNDVTRIGNMLEKLGIRWTNNKKFKTGLYEDLEAYNSLKSGCYCIEISKKGLKYGKYHTYKKDNGFTIIESIKIK